MTIVVPMSSSARELRALACKLRALHSEWVAEMNRLEWSRYIPLKNAPCGGDVRADAMTEDTKKHMQALEQLPGTPTEFHPL